MSRFWALGFKDNGLRHQGLRLRLGEFRVPAFGIVVVLCTLPL